MGKAQKKKAVRRHNPVRVPDSHLPHGLASVSDASSKSGAILPIIQKVCSVDAAERAWACAAVSNLIQNDPGTRRLLQGKNIVGELITRLTDTVEEVAVEAAGALRNLCIDGGYDICAEMYNKNIMAPLRTFPAKISATLQQFLENPKSAPEGARRLVYEFSENIITIFWCLSETSNKALKAVNEANLIPFLVSFLRAHEQLPLPTVVAAAQCLYVLTDDNDVAIDALQNEAPYVNSLLKLAQTESPNLPLAENNNVVRWTTLRVLVSGVLRNISPLPSMMPASTIDMERTIILPLLVPQLSVKLQEVTSKVLELLPQLVDEFARKPSLQHTPGTDHRNVAEQELGYTEERLRLTQLSLEILTGICAKLPEPEPAEEEGGEDNDEESADNDEEIEILDAAANGKESDEPRQSTNDLVTLLTGPLVELVYPTSLSFPPSATDPSPHPPTTSALGTIHIRALECLNNLFFSVDEAANNESGLKVAFTTQDRRETNTIWNAVWRALGAVGKVVADGKITAVRGLERKAEMWEIAVGVLWGIARIGRGYIAPDAEQVQALMEFCNASTDDMTRVKCIGALECVAQNVQAVDANKVISEYLLAQLASPSAAYTDSCLQAVSALIDIYSDEESAYDINFRQGGYLQALQKALPGVRKLVRAIDRRKPGGTELRGRGDDILLNLGAFIKYRKGLKFA
ncbi:hypothetical protein M422DRAFT_154105 [Sphaerobolus stellatus SS14]|nr:hypothetical protein M422DRAFT_154105 [Sphaerobolus stellatus SS14]